MTLPVAIVQPEGSQIAEEHDWGLESLDLATNLEYFTLDFITLSQIGGATIREFLDSWLIQQALNAAGADIWYMVRFEMGPLQSFVVPGISVRIGDQVYVSPFAGQVVEGGWRNWLVGLGSRG